jgi:hypothetical protein
MARLSKESSDLRSELSWKRREDLMALGFEETRELLVAKGSLQYFVDHHWKLSDGMIHRSLISGLDAGLSQLRLIGLVSKTSGTFPEWSLTERGRDFWTRLEAEGLRSQNLAVIDTSSIEE